MIVIYDEHGAPSYTLHWLLYDLDEHVAMMDVAGIDAALLTSAAGMCADLETSRCATTSAKKAETDYPGRFIGAAHAHPLGGADAHFASSTAASTSSAVPGVVITSEIDGKYLDDPEFEPFWTECEKLGLFVFVHPALKLNLLAAVRRLRHRALGRPRVLAGHGDDPADQFRRVRSPPQPHVHMSHLGGGHRRACSARIRRYQDKDFWGTPGNARHG